MKADEKGPAAGAEDRAGLLSWFVVISLAAFFLAWGAFIFFTVGDKGLPPWHFGVVQDIPGESAYTEYGPTFVPGEGLVVPPQHVDEETIRPYGIIKEMK